MRELFKGHQIFKSNTTQLQKYKKTTGCPCPIVFIFSDQIIYLGFFESEDAFQCQTHEVIRLGTDLPI